MMTIIAATKLVVVVGAVAITKAVSVTIEIGQKLVAATTTTTAAISVNVGVITIVEVLGSDSQSLNSL